MTTTSTVIRYSGFPGSMKQRQVDGLAGTQYRTHVLGRWCIDGRSLGSDSMPKIKHSNDHCASCEGPKV